MFCFPNRAVLITGLLLPLIGCSGSSGGVNSAGADGASGDQPAPVPLPRLTLSASPSTVNPGARANLNWTTSNVDACQASGGWSGAKATEGSQQTTALADSTSFDLRCSGPGGSVSRSVTVTVNADQALPQVTLAASASRIDSGQQVELTWTSSAAQQCTASGAWSGSVSLQGSQLSAPLTTNSTFNLRCSNDAGTTMAMVSVDITGLLSLRWQAPTENVDGTPLTDLAGYRVYFGETSRNYSEIETIDDPATTSVDLAVAAGSYYVALTAIDTDNNESGYSNEILKQTN